MGADNIVLGDLLRRDGWALKKPLDQVVFVGGATKIPLLRKNVMLCCFRGADEWARRVATGVDVDEIVAVGAAIDAGIV